MKVSIKKELLKQAISMPFPDDPYIISDFSKWMESDLRSFDDFKRKMQFKRELHNVLEEDNEQKK